MSGRQGWSNDAKRRAARAHAKHTLHCSCGKIVRGNGGKAAHVAMHERREDGHREIGPAAWDLKFEVVKDGAGRLVTVERITPGSTP